MLSKVAAPERMVGMAGFRWATVLGRIVPSSFLRGVLLLSSGTFAAQLFQLACAPILTRVYRPEDLGALALFLSTVGLLAVFAAWRYEVVIPLPKEEVEAAPVFVLSLISIGISSVVLMLLMWLGRYQVAAWSGVEHAASLFWLIPAGVLLTSLHATFSSWLVRHRDYRPLAWNSVVQSVLQGGLQITLALAGMGGSGLMYGDLLARCGGCGLLGRRGWLAGSASIRHVRLGDVIAAAKRYWRFPIFSSGAAFLNAAAIHGPLLFFAFLYDVRVVGWIALAQRILGAPTSLLSSSVARVYFSECARMRHENPRGLLPLFYQTLMTQTVLAFFLVLCVALPAPWLCGLIFGAEWNSAGWSVLALSLMFASKLVSYPVGSTLDVFELQGWHLIRELVRVVCLSAVFFSAATWQWGPLTTTVLFSLAATFPYLLGIAMVWWVLSGVSHDGET